MTTLWSHDVYDIVRGVSLRFRCELWRVADGGWEVQVYASDVLEATERYDSEEDARTRAAGALVELNMAVLRSA